MNIDVRQNLNILTSNDKRLKNKVIAKFFKICNHLVFVFKKIYFE